MRALLFIASKHVYGGKRTPIAYLGTGTREYMHIDTYIHIVLTGFIERMMQVYPYTEWRGIDWLALHSEYEASMQAWSPASLVVATIIPSLSESSLCRSSGSAVLN